jgi:hypothetical protein
LRGLLLLVIALGPAGLACTAPESDPPASTVARAPLRGSGPAAVVDPTTGDELRRAAVEPLRAETEGSAAFALERRTAGTSFRPVPGAGRVLAATTLVGGRALWVEERAGRGTLRLEEDGRARTLDDDVLPELAVSPDGSRVLYVRRARNGAELVLLEPSTGSRTVVYAGPTADRPVFRDDGRTFAFVGTGDGGFAALFVAGEGEPARQRTNLGLRTGHGLPRGFVPPPLGVEGTSFTRDELRYRSPTGTCTVPLPAGEARCAEAAP